MRKRALALFVIVVGLILGFAFVPAHSQEDITGLADKAFGDRQRPAAVFVHEEHNEKAEIEECNVCHHLYQDGKKVEDESSEDMECSECHKVEGGSPTRPLMKGYHDLCKSCHRANKAGPVTCGECHLK
jgi:hypothetical protein